MVIQKIKKREPFSENGFTVLKLLVMMIVGAMLLAFIAVLVISARAKERDTRRETDIKQIQNTLSIYSVNSQKFPECPLSVIDGTTDCLSDALMVSESINQIPSDPLGGAVGVCGGKDSHVYCYESDGLDYTLHYRLETDDISGKSGGWQTAGP